MQSNMTFEKVWSIPERKPKFNSRQCSGGMENTVGAVRQGQWLPEAYACEIPVKGKAIKAYKRDRKKSYHMIIEIIIYPANSSHQRLSKKEIKINES